MRILHLIHSEGIYGAERILLYLAVELQRLGHEAVIGSIRDPGTPQTPFESLAISQGLRVVPIRIAPRPTPGTIRSLLRTIRSVDPDVLHSHGYKANILLAPVPRSTRGAMLSTLHGWTSPRRFTALWLYEQLDRLSLLRLDAVVVVARHMLGLPALRAIPDTRRQLIENGIPSLQDRLGLMRTLAVPPLPDAVVRFVTAAPTLVALGRLSPEKGFDLLIDAFAASCGEGTAHRLLLIGEGPERAALLEQVSRLGLQERVMLAGYLEGADRVLEHAAGFVMSSLTEGMPLALLEAMQWGRPIVATAVGAIPDLLGDGRAGFLVQPGSVPALQAALHTLLREGDEASRRALVAQQAVESHYSSARMAEQYLDTYRKIAA